MFVYIQPNKECWEVVNILVEKMLTSEMCVKKYLYMFNARTTVSNSSYE